MSCHHQCRHCNRVQFRSDFFPKEDANETTPATVRHTKFDITWTDVKAAAVDDCTFFKQLIRESRDLQYEPFPEVPSHDVFLCANCTVPSRGAASYADVAFGLITSGKAQHRLERYWHFSEKDSYLSQFATYRPMNPSPDTEHTYELARSWLKECLTTHGHGSCEDQTFLPTRLIQISTSSSAYEMQIIHPHEQEYEDKSIPFVALSYCWGGDQPHKLTRQRLEVHKCILDYAIMPRTIQDAVRVTANLGYSFLWVDSLCIMQDDGEEKLREIPKMPQVYSNAIVVIEAISARCASEGYLGPRKVSLNVVDLPYQDGGGENGWISLLPDDHEDGLPHNRPLHARAWALQEHLLATRCLEFRLCQLRFSCSKTINQLGYTDGWRELPGHMSGWPDTDPIVQNVPSSFPDRQTFYHYWFKLVEVYTARNVTIASDRALAISGVAGRLQEVASKHVDVRYVAGHWMPAIGLDLLWDVERYHPIPGPSTNRNPSWSWLSVNGTISYNDMFDTDQSSVAKRPPPCPDTLNVAKLVHINYSLQDASAPFGAVKEAYLSLRALVAYPRNGFIADRHGIMTLNLQSEDSQPPIHEEIAVFKDAAGYEFEEHFKSSEVYLLLIARVGPQSWEDRVVGLDLRRTGQSDTTHAVDRYKRIGLWKWYHRGSGWKAFPENPGTDPEDVYKRLDRLGFEEKVVELE